MTTHANKRGFSPEQAAEYVGLTRDRIYRLVADGTLPFRRVGRSLVFLREDLDAFLDALAVEDAA